MQQFIDTLINGPARYTQEHDFSSGWALVFVLGALFIEFGVAYLLILLIIKLFQYSRTFLSLFLQRIGVGKREVEYAFLQLTFPSDTTKSAYATEQLHILMRSMVKYRSFWDRLAARKQPYSLELVATRDDGIRYIIRIPKQEAETVRRTLISFLPGLKITETEDYLPVIIESGWSIAELKLSSDFVAPLADHKTLEEHDPIAYLTGHMRSLLPDELVAFQIVAVPVFDNTHPNELRHIRDTQHRIALSKEIAPKLTAYKIDIKRILLRIAVAPFWLIAMGAKLVGVVFNAIFSGDIPKSSGNKRLTGDPYEQELGKTIKTKLDQHLFEVTMRVLVISPDGDSAGSRLSALKSSFDTFTASYQSIANRRRLPFTSIDKWLGRFRKRELLRHIASQQTILSSSELSDLYHFPNTDLTKTEGLVKTRSRELAAPLSIKRSDANLDVIVGANAFGGEVQEIGMTLEQRQKHTYIIGKTGTGKTTLLKSAIYQDMLNDKGLAVLDPHGDMFRELLSIVPENRRKDVVVFDPSDRDYPVGLNILDPGIEFESEDDKHEWITSAVLSIFKKLSDEAQWGPRMEHILRNTTLTALQTPKPSLYTLQRLLTDKKYQKEVAKTLKDPVLKQFWDKEFKLMGSMQMSAATAPLTHRLGHFITSKMSRHILLQEKSTVRIADIMNEGKILLVNLSKGDIGEDQSEFFGTILTALIWMAAYQRTKIPEKKRKDFFVYVDEFQNFATPQFGAITSEGRKFHVSLIVSHQNVAQMEDKDLVKVIAGNAATIICLRANPEDEAFLLPYMKPEVEKGDIVNLAPYHFYMKVATEDSEEAFSGQTVPLDIEESEKVRKTVVANSRKKFAAPKAKVEEYMETLLSGEAQESQKKSVTVRKEARPKLSSSNLHDI
jgi:type IV secretory pathway TraG/TraD family ATPase VirD4